LHPNASEYEGYTFSTLQSIGKIDRADRILIRGPTCVPIRTQFLGDSQHPSDYVPSDHVALMAYIFIYCLEPETTVATNISSIQMETTNTDGERLSPKDNNLEIKSEIFSSLIFLGVPGVVAIFGILYMWRVSQIRKAWSFEGQKYWNMNGHMNEIE